MHKLMYHISLIRLRSYFNYVENLSINLMLY